jgi:hypothetical protein
MEGISMKTINLTISCAVFAAVLSAGVWAKADTVTLDFTNASPSATVSTNMLPGVAGALNWKVTAVANSSGNNPFVVNQSISTFCIDAKHRLVDPDKYTIAYSPTLINSDNANVLTHFWATNISKVTGSVTAAAFQVAIWEIVYDHDSDSPPPFAYSTGDLSSGVFRIYGPSSVITQADTWLKGSFMSTDVSHWHLVELDANNPICGGQGQVYAYKDNLPNNSVPLPAALPVGLAMMLGMAMVRKISRGS